MYLSIKPIIKPNITAKIALISIPANCNPPCLTESVVNNGVRLFLPPTNIELKIPAKIALPK